MPVLRMHTRQNNLGIQFTDTLLISVNISEYVLTVVFGEDKLFHELLLHSWAAAVHRKIASRFSDGAIKLLKLRSGVAEEAGFSRRTRTSASTRGNMDRIVGTKVLRTSQQVSSVGGVSIMPERQWHIPICVWKDRSSPDSSGYSRVTSSSNSK